MLPLLLEPEAKCDNVHAWSLELHVLATGHLILIVTSYVLVGFTAPCCKFLQLSGRTDVDARGRVENGEHIVPRQMHYYPPRLLRRYVLGQAGVDDGVTPPPPAKLCGPRTASA
jgi:hypothetical protein